VIWHILKKDFRLLWPLIALVAAIHLGNAALLAFGGQFAPSSLASDGPGGGLGWISNSALPFVGLLGLTILVIAVFQQDRLPGTTQDWLTRPIPRGKMLAAKILLIALAGLAPILLCDISLGLVEKLHPSEVVAASLRRTVGLACFICLPTMMVAIVTRSLTEALIFSLAVVVTVLIASVFSEVQASMPLLQSGSAWTIALVLLVANVIAVAVMLRLQLQWRSTNRVRWIALAYLCVSPAVVMLPWSVGYGLQKALTPDSSRPPGTVRIDASRAITFSVPGGRQRVSNGDGPYVSIIVPVALPKGAGNLRWVLDHANAELIEPADGNSFNGRVGMHLVTLIRGGQPTLVLQTTMLLEAFQRARQRHAVLRATLFLTTLLPTAKPMVVSLDRGGIDEFSRCGWPDGNAMRCISTRPVGTCVAVMNGAGRAGYPNRSFSCGGVSYAPWTLPIWRDPYYTYMPGEQVGTVLWTYKPGAHFAQQIEFTLDKVVQESGLNNSVDGTATAARFANPGGMVVDTRGNLFVIDTTDSVVRKISPSGEVTTYAGQKGVIGTGDGQREVAQFNRPAAIAVDSADNLYVADTGNALIRKISSSGVVSTIAGNGKSQGDDGSGVRLRRPGAIVCAADGILYVVDYNEDGSPSIRKVLPDGTVTTAAGPETEVSSPEGLVVDKVGGN